MFVKSMGISEYKGEPYVEINKNMPNFSKYPEVERYKNLGSYKINDKEYRICSVYVCIGNETISDDKYISKRSRKIFQGYKYYDTKYDFIKGKHLYNICHLIGYQFLKDSDIKNLILGTRYMNERGMQPFEEKIVECLKNKENQVNHILYRVTPVFDGENQLAKGVQMEAFSVEDYGKEICFNVFCYNVQPGVSINYETGKSDKVDEWCSKILSQNIYADEKKGTQNYILNTGAHIFHNPSCDLINHMNGENKMEFKYARQLLICNRYKPCKNCKP